MVVITTTCTSGVFLLPISSFTDVHKHAGVRCNLHSVVVAVVVVVVVICIYVYVCVCVHVCVVCGVGRELCIHK